MAEYGPEVPVPVIGDENALPSKFERIAAERRAADAQKQLDRLGKVNPLALEEYEALTERHNFLATQLEDIRKTRRDLLTVVKEVDDRVQEVFASAYATPPASSSTSSAACSPAARATWCSPSRTTCWPPASRSKPGRQARRSSGCPCCPAGSGH